MNASRNDGDDSNDSEANEFRNFDCCAAGGPTKRAHEELSGGYAVAGMKLLGDGEGSGADTGVAAKAVAPSSALLLRCPSSA